MSLITSLLLLLICARLFGRLFKLFGFQEIFGEIVGGLLISMTSLVSPGQQLDGIVELAIFLLIFEAGLEMKLQDIFSALRKKSVIVALTAFSISFTTGCVIGLVFIKLQIVSSIVVGLCCALTALPIVIGFLQNLKIMDTKVGHLIMGSSVVIDIIVLLCMGVVFDMEKTGGSWEFITIFVTKTIKMAFFFVAIMLVNKFLRSEISRARQTEAFFTKLIDWLGAEAIFGLGVVFVLGFSTLSETLGFHFIIGAFFGGLLLNKDIIGTDAFHTMNTTLSSITRHFLTPVFFAYIGLHFSLQAFNEWKILLLVLVCAFASKIFGAWLGGRFVSLNNKQALQIGIILNSRGVLDLIIAELAYSKGYLDANMFSILVFLGLSSVILNPILYRRFISSVNNVSSTDLLSSQSSIKGDETDGTVMDSLSQSDKNQQ